MKYFTLVSPFLVMYSIFTPTVVLTIPLIICILNNNMSDLLIVVLLHLLLNLMLFLFFHSAFILVNYSECGIKNKFLNLSFDDIQYATVIDVELLKYSLIPTIKIQLICLSTTKQKSSFWNYSKNDCILLPNTPKVLRQLKECSRNRSNAIRDLWTQGEHKGTVLLSPCVSRHECWNLSTLSCSWEKFW